MLISRYFYILFSILRIIKIGEISFVRSDSLIPNSRLKRWLLTWLNGVVTFVWGWVVMVL